MRMSSSHLVSTSTLGTAHSRGVEQRMLSSGKMIVFIIILKCLEITMEGPMYFFEKKMGKKQTQELILESRSEKKKVYFWVLDHFPMTKPIHRSQEQPLRLQEDFLETHRRLGISHGGD